jgi:RNA polymerase sigma factor (sigma-70 family)
MMRTRTGDTEIARELTQDALVAAWRGIRDGRLRDPTRLAAFVHGAARNILNNYHRASAREPEVRPLPEEVHQLPLVSDETTSDRLEIAGAALRRLAPQDRQILLMTLIRGLQPREIAQELGLTVDVVRTRKSRALKRAVEAVQELSRARRSGH